MIKHIFGLRDNYLPIALLIAILFSISANAQPGSMEDVRLRNDSLFRINKNNEWVFKGSVKGGALPPFSSLPALMYDSASATYISAGANALGVRGFANVIIGSGAFEKNQTGAYNTALGLNVLKNNTGGRDNFGAGWDVLYNNTTGNGNVAIVQDALYSNTGGYNNIAMGKGSMFYNTTGHSNVSLGYFTLNYKVTGDENIAIGPYAGGFLEKGDGNIFIGSYAGELNDFAVGKTINDAIAIGRYTGLSAAHTRSISIGYNIQSTGDSKINIGNVYKGDILTGNAEVKSISISDRKVTFDDNYMYVTTSTGVIKKVPLQELSSTTAKSNQATNTETKLPAGRYVFYTPSGQLLYGFRIN